ncbi:MAG: MgtC/SapB family protein [Candidatus Omnitrophota bacterium]
MFSDTEILKRLSFAVVLSGLIGLERELHRRTAGLRTHILVSLGSCLIMLTSIYVFDIYKGEVAVDPARIAAGVITGIGFLGAGTIIREREGVKGLTTAASLWVVAGLGLSVGCGFYSAAIFTTVLSLIVLFLLRYLEGVILLNEQRKNLKGGRHGI